MNMNISSRVIIYWISVPCFIAMMLAKNYENRPMSSFVKVMHVILMFSFLGHGIFSNIVMILNSIGLVT